MLEQASPELQKVLFQKFPNFRLITKNDAVALREFLRETPMETPLVSLSYDRGEDYVASLDEQGETTMGWLLESENGAIEGLAHLYIKKMFYQGRVVRCGYLGDLRIQANVSREKRIQFRELYREFIENLQKIPEVCGCEFILAAIMGGNRKAILSMAKPNRYFRYHFLGSYDTQTIFWRLPKLSLPSSHLRIRQGPFSHVFDFHKFDFQEESNALPEQTCRVINERGVVLGQFVLWEPQKKLYFHKMSKRLKLIGQAPKLFHRSPLKEKSRLHAHYLSNVCFAHGISENERDEVLAKILDFAYEKFRESGNQALLVSGPRSWGLPTLLKRKGFVFLPGQGHLFQVTPNQFKEILRPKDFYFDISRS